MKYTSALDAFVKSGKEFAMVYKSAAFTGSASRMLILDSSFNPPHMAHFTLAKEASEFDFADKNAASSPTMLLLLLSVKNADKVVPTPASFEHRLAMMQLMAESLEKLQISVSIGLTNHAKFADKSAAIQNYLNSDASWQDGPPRLTFLLGFDTLVRVLDPKYYAPSTLENSLNSFMTNTDLFCLTRADNSADFERQHNYISRIAKGEYSDIPRSWAANIYMKSVENDRDSIGSISSSSIRRAYENNAAGGAPLLQQIDAYIRSNGLYAAST